MFGSVRKESGYKSISGNGFKIDVPSKWNPSKELEFPGTVLRFEDNFDATSNLSVVIVPAAKSSITDYGTPEKFLEEVNSTSVSILVFNAPAAPPLINISH